MLVKVFENTSILDKTVENINSGQHFRKLLVLVKSLGKFRFWSNIRKIPIHVNLPKNPDFGPYFRNLDFGQKFWKISILANI